MSKRSQTPPDSLFSPGDPHNPHGDGAIRDKINELVARLPATLVYSLLSEIESMAEQPPERVRLVRRFVVEHLNRQRVHRARRLFTTLFDPVLIDDDVLYHAGLPVPGMLQRADAGALWEVLSRDGFPLLAVETQETLDAAATDEPLDRVMLSPQAQGLRERMRVAALKHLDAVATDRKAATATLAALSRNRPRRQRLAAAHLDRPPSFDPEAQRMAHLVLAHQPGALVRVLEWLRDIPSAAHDRNAQATAGFLTTGVDALNADGGEAVSHLLPLLALHLRRHYEAVALYIAHHGVPAPRCLPVVAALTAHFVGACRALTALLAAVLALNERMPGTPIRPTVKERARVEALLDRVGQIMAAARAGTLLEDRHTEPVFSLAWSALGKAIGGRVAAVALERAAVAAGARRAHATDGEETVWLLGFLASFHAMALGFGLSTLDLGQWREIFLEEMRANMDRAMKIGPDDSLDERMQHLLRINTLCRIFGQRVTEWIGPTSHSMVRMLTHRAGTAAGMDPEERALANAFLATARAELGRSRYWKSDELVELVELLEKHEEPPPPSPSTPPPPPPPPKRKSF